MPIIKIRFVRTKGINKMDIKKGKTKEKTFFRTVLKKNKLSLCSFIIHKRNNRAQSLMKG